MYLLPNSQSKFNIVGQIFQTLYGVCSIILFLEIINIFFANRKQTIIDKISNITIIDPFFSPKESKKREESNYRLPGVILPDEIVE